MLARGIPGAVETKGSDPDELKVQKIRDFISGKTRVLVSKTAVCGFGLNLQFCADTGFVGLNDSWEQYFQAVRRFWRFGQTQPVNVHMIAAETEGNVVQNLQRKERDADRMLDAMVAQTRDITSKSIRGSVRENPKYDPRQKMELPSWS
jgi:SNF2 family DNA or RNA helicase